MRYELLIIFFAYLLDLIFGDPQWFPHPVRGIGLFIGRLERPCRSLVRNQRLSGAIFAVVIVALTWFITFFLIKAVSYYNRFLGVFFSSIVLYTTIAVKDLKIQSMKVYSALKNKNIHLARLRLSMIVGRDVENLDEAGIIRATVETVAENIVDGIISPLFYAFLGGVPLALAYKAVNTLDSMVGYKNEKYRDFGWASARLDDLFNFIPARISILFLLIAGWLAGGDARNSWRIILRDRKNNPSPNSGIPEAAVAGALRIQLGGVNYYNSLAVEKPFIGDSFRPFKIEQIREALRIAYIVSALFLIFGVGLYFLVLRNKT